MGIFIPPLHEKKKTKITLKNKILVLNTNRFCLDIAQGLVNLHRSESESERERDHDNFESDRFKGFSIFKEISTI